MKQAFKVIEHKFSPLQPDAVSRLVKANLSQHRANGLRDKLNAGQDLNSSEIILSYAVHPMNG